MDIVGARGGARPPEAVLAVLRRLAANAARDVQVLDARSVLGRDHLMCAGEHAERAMRQGTNVAKTLAVEFVVYAAAERQISNALAKVGIRDDTTEFAVVVFGGDAEKVLRELGLTRDDGVLEPTAAKLLAFGLTEAELATVPPGRAADLVLERVALVDLLK